MDSGDFWIETKDDATGKPYFYHSTTLQTSWKRPEGLIVQESDLEIVTEDEDSMNGLGSSAAAGAGVATSTAGAGSASASAESLVSAADRLCTPVPIPAGDEVAGAARARSLPPRPAPLVVG